MILHRDDDWLVVAKPTGLAVHAPEPGRTGVVEWLALHRNETAHVVSRLDRGTSGVLLLARHAAASAEAQRIHEEAAAAKIYEFLSAADSVAAGAGQQWERDEDLDGKPARTCFRRLGAFAPGPGAARVSSDLAPGQPLYHYRAEIARGRRHQIRRHAAATGIPLLGDGEYGGPDWPRLCLHCSELRWPGLAEPLRSALPASFTALFGGSAGETALHWALARDRRGGWPATVGDAWRIVHRDEIPGLPVAIDRYGDRFNVIWFDEEREPDPDDPDLAYVLDALAADFGCRGGVLRGHRRNPHRRTLVDAVRTIGEPPRDTFSVVEHGLRYEIDLMRTQHTGLFLDQRDSRRRIALRAKNARLANLFAFTCSFAVAAAAGGAEVAFSVDVARACLNTGQRNFELNGLSEGGRGKFIQQDARRWLKRQLRRREEGPAEFQPLDLVVCDPPVFASSKDGGKFSLVEEWPRLARDVATLLAPDGAALFANNHRGGHDRTYGDALRQSFGRVEAQRPPLDFPVLGGRPPHVRIYFCTEPIPG